MVWSVSGWSVSLQLTSWSGKVVANIGLCNRKGQGIHGPCLLSSCPDEAFPHSLSNTHFSLFCIELLQSCTSSMGRLLRSPSSSIEDYDCPSQRQAPLLQFIHLCIHLQLLIPHGLALSPSHAHTFFSPEVDRCSMKICFPVTFQHVLSDRHQLLSRTGSGNISRRVAH